MIRRRYFVSGSSRTPFCLPGGMAKACVLDQANTNLEYVVNTNWDLFFDKTSAKFFLLYKKMWLTAAALEGPWSATTKLPADLSKIPDQPNWADVKKAVPPPANAGGPAPKVFGSTAPAEDHHVQWLAGIRQNSRHRNFLTQQHTGEQCFPAERREPILLFGRRAVVPRPEPRRAVDLPRPTICLRTLPKFLRTAPRLPRVDFGSGNVDAANDAEVLLA